jgi:hypothetical protein
MTNKHSTEKSLDALPYSELLDHTILLYNEMDNLMTLHHFFYQAAEHFFEDQALSFKRGLSLFPSWLRERDLAAMESLYLLRETLRAGPPADSTDKTDGEGVQS